MAHSSLSHDTAKDAHPKFVREHSPLLLDVHEYEFWQRHDITQCETCYETAVARLESARALRVPTVRIKESIPEGLRWEVFERDDFTCQHCGARRYLSVDHIWPESKGGRLELGNVQTLCRSCNSRKGAR